MQASLHSLGNSISALRDPARPKTVTHILYLSVDWLPLSPIPLPPHSGLHFSLPLPWLPHLIVPQAISPTFVLAFFPPSHPGALSNPLPFSCYIPTSNPGINWTRLRTSPSNNDLTYQSKGNILSLTPYAQLQEIIRRSPLSRVIHSTLSVHSTDYDGLGIQLTNSNWHHHWESLFVDCQPSSSTH